MAEDPGWGALDRLVETLARWLDRMGLRGTQLRWRWQRWRRRLLERRERALQLQRSVRAPHRMCPACRALVPRGARRCAHCGESLEGAPRPGIGRVLTQLFPGATAATSLILLANGFWFVLMLMAQMRRGEPMSLFGSFSGELLVRFGSGLSRPVAELRTGGEWWRMVTPIFLHGSLLHFFFNSFLLLQLGPLVEHLYGTRRFWVLYVGSGLAGSAASQWPRFVNTVGASGAIFGLIGALFVLGLRRGGVLGESMRALLWRLILYSAILSLFFRLDHLNHLGGFAAGAAFGRLVDPGAATRRSGERLWDLAAWSAVGLVLVAFGAVARASAL